MKNRKENGLALITALLVLLLVSSIIIGLSWMVMTDQRLGGNNSDRERAFYGAEAGMEKMTADMGARFQLANGLTAVDLAALNAAPPAPNAIPGVAYNGPLGYNIAPVAVDAAGNPLATVRTILPPSAFAGMNGLITPFALTVTAQTTTGSQVRMQRHVQTVGIPVFQFGIFSQVDLSYFPGPVFNFGGRVHTNGNLWLAAGSTLQFDDKVTSSAEVILTNLSNGHPTPIGYTGQVLVDTVPQTSWAQLTRGSTTGTSVVGAIGPEDPTWTSVSLGTFMGDILGGPTKIAPLNLTLATPGIGGTPIALITRPVPGELAANPGLLAERLYSQASLRILLSDYGPGGNCATSDILALPNISGGNPVDLADFAWDPANPSNPNNARAAADGYTQNVPLPVSGAQVGTYAAPGAYNANDGYWIAPHHPIITGCIKIDRQNAVGVVPVWTDVTQEILNLGFIGRNLNPQSAAQLAGEVRVAGIPPLPGLPGGQIAPSNCPDPSPNAIIRLARLRDNPSSAYPGGGCGVAAPGATPGTDLWPNVLFDPREAQPRDNPVPNIPSNALPPVTGAGVMNYVELDVNNLARWFSGAIAGTGNLANNVTGYTLYFSDRRGNAIDTQDPLGRGLKWGELGFNDFVNSFTDPANGCPNGALEQGEDLDADGAVVVRTYGGTPNNGLNFIPGVPRLGMTPVDAASPLQVGAPAILGNPNCAAAIWPGMIYSRSNNEARENPPLFFRRALKLVNGQAFNIGACNGVPCGLTVVAENPAYVQGDYNTPGNGAFPPAGNPAASLMADATNFLSNNWNDVNSFSSPYNTGGRRAVTTTYRLAAVSGKGLEFPQVAGTGQDYGTDGGVHNFLRYIENWGGSTLFYKGSIVSFYYNRQSVGPFKCCTTVYSPPTRGYSFDVEFLTPALLPPRTPMFRDVNNVGFSQVVTPGR